MGEIQNTQHCDPSVAVILSGSPKLGFSNLTCRPNETDIQRSPNRVTAGLVSSMLKADEIQHVPDVGILSGTAHAAKCSCVITVHLCSCCTDLRIQHFVPCHHGTGGTAPLVDDRLLLDPDSNVNSWVWRYHV